MPLPIRKRRRRTDDSIRTFARRLITLTAFALVASGSAFTIHAADTPQPSPIHVRNFAAVNDHLLRGGQPETDGFRELASNHVVMVINLRESGSGSEAERRTVESLGMQYVNVPIPRTAAPSFDQIKRILSLIAPDDRGKVFVHCLRGKDRTGTVIACYRIQHDGWNGERAAAEARRLGMSRAEFGMRSFILHFHPVDLPAPAAIGK